MTDKQPPATIKDLMLITGLGRETVKALIRTGHLPGQKLGQRYVIPRGEFDAFYEGRWESKAKPIEPVKAPQEPEKPTTKKPTDFVTRRDAA